MILRRVAAPSMREALRLAGQALGADALILETRRTSGGVEVLAARAQPPRPRAPARRERGLSELAARARAAGLSEVCVGTLERALRDLGVFLDRPGDPALPGLATRVLGALLPVRPMERLSPRLALVGPTGVGKTTTLAKLAARAARQEGLRVVLVTVDLHRVAAVEQLRAFGDLLGAEVEVAFTPADLRRALRAHAGADRILVDTAGRSPRDGGALEALAGTFRDLPVERMLCVPAATRRSDMERIFEAYGRLAPSSLAVTKWDETESPGEVLSWCIETGFPLCLRTDGQSVPEDLHAASPAEMAGLLLAGGAR